MGKSEEGRSKEHNKRTAFNRMAETKEFKDWLRLETALKLGLVEEINKEVDKMMNPKHLLVEVKNAEGQWVKLDG